MTQNLSIYKLILKLCEMRQLCGQSDHLGAQKCNIRKSSISPHKICQPDLLPFFLLLLSCESILKLNRRNSQMGVCACVWHRRLLEPFCTSGTHFKVFSPLSFLQIGVCSNWCEGAKIGGVHGSDTFAGGFFSGRKTKSAKRMDYVTLMSKCRAKLGLKYGDIFFFCFNEKIYSILLLIA